MSVFTGNAMPPVHPSVLPICSVLSKANPCSNSAVQSLVHKYFRLELSRNYTGIDGCLSKLSPSLVCVVMSGDSMLQVMSGSQAERGHWPMLVRRNHINLRILFKLFFYKTVR